MTSSKITSRQPVNHSQLQQALGSLCPTFCSRVISSEWFCICAFLRLACKASTSAWALLCTWAISSFALEGQKQRHRLGLAQLQGRQTDRPPSLPGWVSGTHSLSFSSAWIFSAWYLWPSFSIFTMHSPTYFFSDSSF